MDQKEDAAAREQPEQVRGVGSRRVQALDGQGLETELSPTLRQGAGQAERALPGAALGPAHGGGARPRVSHSIRPTQPQEAGQGRGGGSGLRPGWTWAHRQAQAVRGWRGTPRAEE